MDATQKAVTKKKKSRFFETYISKVLKQVSETNGITANSKQQLNSILCLIARLIATQVISLTEVAKKKTMSEKEVKNALRIVLPGDLATNAITEGQKAVDTFEGEDTSKGVSRQERAGIVFPPAIAEKFLRNFGYSKAMVTGQAPVCLAGALEYLASEILENASSSAKDNKRVRITIRDLEIGIRNDSELNEFFVDNQISFLGGGVMPFVHPSLLTKKKRNKKRNKKATATGEKKSWRFRPGTVSLREIRRFQKLSNCLTFAKFPFEKFVREVIASNSDGETMKVSRDVFIVLQYFIEQRIVELLRNANFAAIHAGRVKLMPIDIDFVRAVSSGSLNPHQKGAESTDTPDIEDVEVGDQEEELVEDEDEEELVEDEEELVEEA